MTYLVERLAANGVRTLKRCRYETTIGDLARPATINASDPMN
jgi:hypothetical protein